MNQRCSKSIVYLTPQAVNMNIDEVRRRIVGFIPDVFGNFGPAYDPPSLAGEILEQRVLFGGKRDILTAASYPLAACINHQIGDLDCWWAKDMSSPHQGAQ